ncbi:hypothetical protein RN001_009294 [Aquatica leii]|uniref:UBX domain-containing protein n=1 Tax=Aquatica leii TaxID=1421715 RepID=A0AAN7P6F7_9COLE|nr:hypothetical protein RN001_009294 [Aquatica leii]
MEKAVVVLAPNGRRQTVKVDLNATILQILEEVCRKQGLKSEEYDIKHHNKCLDTSTIIRFSGLPNNAQLELSEATRTRCDGIVTLGLQLEDGTRLTDSFSPNNSLTDVLVKLCPDEMKPETNPVIIYMRREIYGETSFKDTTLRSLGLTNGRAMLRLIHKTPEELHTQANVSAPLPSRPAEEQPYIRPFKQVESPPRVTPVATQFNSNTPQMPSKPKSPPPIEQNLNKKENPITQSIKEEKRESTSLKRPPSTVPTQVNFKQPNKENTVAEEEFVFLGERNAMVFSQETAEAIPTSELPDDFFELTITDAKKLLKDIKKRRMDIENAPFQTKAVRSLLKSTQQLGQLNKYKQAVIRVNFPDQTVLQGVFKPIDTVETIMNFVREYLDDKNIEFYLYTAPPKEIMNKSSRLIEVNCVPNAILHFGTKEPPKNSLYLRKDLFNKFTTASLASLAAAKTRSESTRVTTSNTLDDVSLGDSSSDDVNVGASTSQGKEYEDYARRTPSSGPTTMPKWFKPPK